MCKLILLISSDYLMCEGRSSTPPLLLVMSSQLKTVPSVCEEVETGGCVSLPGWGSEEVRRGRPHERKAAARPPVARRTPARTYMRVHPLRSTPVPPRRDE